MLLPSPIQRRLEFCSNRSVLSRYMYHRIVFNYELWVLLRFAINRLNVHVYYNTVWVRPLQLLDSQFGLTSRNITIKPHNNLINGPVIIIMRWWLLLAYLWCCLAYINRICLVSPVVNKWYKLKCYFAHIYWSYPKMI